jgi:RHS repeat-associated protein
VGPDDLGGPTLTRLAVILTDHIGSTDVIVRADLDPATGTWKTASAQPQAERQSFDAWGDRRNAANWSELRTTDAANRQTSAMDYDRGFTGHEMLDDFGLIHMNGRIYDPEIGRFLSPDPYVQVPEYSQNFNRYTYVLNNPLSYTDSSGHFIDWIVYAAYAVYSAVAAATSAVVAAVGAYGAAVAVAWGTGGFLAAAGTAIGGLLAPGVIFSGGSFLSAWGIGQLAVSAYSIGSTIAAGGDLGDVLRGLAVNFVTASISAGVLHDIGSAAGKAWEAGNAATATALTAKHVAGHALLGGLSQEALGGRFQDGFLSAGASTLMMDLGLGAMLEGAGAVRMMGRTAVAAIVGGTASELGGGKFANGAVTAAWQHLLNAEIPRTTETARKSVLEHAVENSSYSLDGQGPKGRWVKGAYKCNAYVYDYLENAGYTPRLDPKIAGRGVPDAGQWANENVTIAAHAPGKKGALGALIGYWKVTKDPAAGDVVAIKLDGEGGCGKI